MGAQQTQIKKQALPGSQIKIKKSGLQNHFKFTHMNDHLEKPRKMPKRRGIDLLVDAQFMILDYISSANCTGKTCP